MAKIEQEYEGSADNVTVKSRKKTSESLPLCKRYTRVVMKQFIFVLAC